MIHLPDFFMAFLGGRHGMNEAALRLLRRRMRRFRGVCRTPLLVRLEHKREGRR